jgi:hypothetical protein
VALLLADGPDPFPDRDAAERALSSLVDAGAVTRTPVGRSAIWRAAAVE